MTKALIWFKSDDCKEYEGFTIEWKAIPCADCNATVVDDGDTTVVDTSTTSHTAKTNTGERKFKITLTALSQSFLIF